MDIRPEDSVASRLASFHGDRRGQILPLIMFIGIAFCIGTGLVMNTGRAVNRRIQAQNAVDAAAVSGASCAARGMNFIARNNVTMSKVLVTIVIVRSFRPAIMAGRIVLLVLQGVCVGMQILAKVLEAIPFTAGIGATLETIAGVLKRKIAQEKKVLKFLYKWMVKKIAKRWDDEILTGHLAGAGNGYGWKFLRGLSLFGDALAYGTPVYAQMTAKAVFGANAGGGGIADRDAWLFPLYPGMPICKGAFAAFSSPVQYGTPKAKHFVDLTVGVEPIANMIGLASILPLTLSGFWIGYPVTAHLELTKLFGAGPVYWGLPGLPELDLCEEDDSGSGGDAKPEDPESTPPLPIPADEQATLKRQIDAISTYSSSQKEWDADTNPYRFEGGAWVITGAITSQPPATPPWMSGGTALSDVSAGATKVGRTDIVSDIAAQTTTFSNLKASAPLNEATKDDTLADGEWLPDLVKTKTPHASKADRLRQYDRMMKRDERIKDLKHRLLEGPWGPQTFDDQGQPVPLGDYGGAPIGAGNHAPPNGLLRDVAYANALIALKKDEIAKAKAASKEKNPEVDDATVVALLKELALLENRRDYLDGQRYELEADLNRLESDRSQWQTRIDETVGEADTPPEPDDGSDAEPASDPDDPPKRPELTKRYHPYVLEGPDAWPRSFTYFALGYRNITHGTFMHLDRIDIPRTARLFGDPKMPGLKDLDFIKIPGIGHLSDYAFCYAAARVYNSDAESVDLWTANWSARLVRVEIKSLPQFLRFPKYCGHAAAAPGMDGGAAMDDEPAAGGSEGCKGAPDADASVEEKGALEAFLEDCFGVALPGIPNPLEELKRMIQELLPDWEFDENWKLKLPIAPGSLNKH